MSIESEILTIARRFDSIITTDRDGHLRLLYGIETDYHMSHSLIKKIELIISLRGFVRGYEESNGKWMRKEEIIRIIEEDPQWLRTNLVAQEYGI